MHLMTRLRHLYGRYAGIAYAAGFWIGPCMSKYEGQWNAQTTVHKTGQPTTIKLFLWTAASTNQFLKSQGTTGSFQSYASRSRSTGTTKCILMTKPHFNCVVWVQPLSSEMLKANIVEQQGQRTKPMCFLASSPFLPLSFTVLEYSTISDHFPFLIANWVIYSGQADITILKETD